jgi:cytoskeleton protein RodZ
MTSIGDRLRRQRLQNRISLETVSLETKIGVRLLEAIEAEQFEKLPGGVFRRSFVLQYAKALGLDPEEIAPELKQLNQFDDAPTMPTADMIRSVERRGISGFGLPAVTSGPGSTIGSLLAAIGVMMVCAFVYSWMQTPREVRDAPRKEIAAAAPVAPAAVPPAKITAESRTQAADLNTDGAPVRVGLSAGEKTWISISSDGKTVFANLLQAHDTKMIEASEKVRVLVGNAGGLEISLNGKPIGPIGPKGQIRVVELTSAGFQIVPRKSPTLEPL